MNRKQQYAAARLIDDNSFVPGPDVSPKGFRDYSTDWSDDKIAEAVAASEAQVRRLRLDVFGPFIGPKKPSAKETIAALQAEIAALKAGTTTQSSQVAA
jgi:hypothetical protein